jgi:hypothetical protein
MASVQVTETTTRSKRPKKKEKEKEKAEAAPENRDESSPGTSLFWWLIICESEPV